MINSASSQNLLETVAARSVLEMGYSNDHVLQAIEKLKTLKKGMLTQRKNNILNIHFVKPMSTCPE